MAIRTAALPRGKAGALGWREERGRGWIGKGYEEAAGLAGQ